MAILPLCFPIKMLPSSVSNSLTYDTFPLDPQGHILNPLVLNLNWVKQLNYLITLKPFPFQQVLKIQRSWRSGC